jgi:hypothetical protein
MEDVPPSYEFAVDREVWRIVAPWIPSSDLCSACLVSKKWHSIFIPFLWGDPASHFGVENDAVYVALTRFKRTLKKARASVRQLTHTLHLPPALSEIYGGPNSTWLRDVLEYLPHLQSLIVSKLPFFDHHSLLALRHSSTSRRLSFDDEEDEIPLYGLKLLLATREPNSTSASLAEALRHFPQLVYLDLSYTTPARDASVLAALSNLYDLQVLKLRGVGLRDGEAEVLANSIKTRVRLLDVSENLLTDMAVRSLLQACFLPADRHANANRPNGRQVEDWPIGIAPGPDFLSLETLRSEQLDQELLKQLMNPLTGRLAFEDIPHRGLTHLYIADNNLSVEGLSSLLKTTRLHVLDGGTVDTVKTIARTISLSSPTGYRDEISFPGAEKLIPILSTYASNNLTYLRLDHAVVTQRLQSRDVPSPTSSIVELTIPITSTAELPPEERVVFEAPAPAHYPVEMPSERDPIYELPAESAAPRFELAGDCIHFALSPPVGDAPLPSRTASQERLKPVKGDGAFAPEVVVNDNEHQDDKVSSDEEVILNASGTGRTSRRHPSVPNRAPIKSVNIKPVDINPDSPHPATATPVSPLTNPPPSALHIARMETILRKRPVGISARTDLDTSNNTTLTPQGYPISEFHPSALPHLRTLVLTNVPASVPQSSSVIPNLRKLISACADEAQLALLRAKTNYSLPPGRSRQAAEVHHARSLFALSLIVLEIAPIQLEAKNNIARSGPLKGWRHLRQRMSMSKSSTGDPDSETFWSAAENDFSFFGEEGEEQDECGIYQHDPDKYFPTAHLDDKFFVPSEDHVPSSPHGSLRSLENGLTLMRSPTVLQSPRNLPLGRNRRSSSSTSGRDRDSIMAEVTGSIPTSNPVAKPQTPVKADEPTLDVVAELAKFRREKKAEYEAALLQWRIANNPHRTVNAVVVNGTTTDEKDLPFVEGHWKGEIRVVRNAAPKGRTGVVDVYGNYFEKGYLYP